MRRFLGLAPLLPAVLVTISLAQAPPPTILVEDAHLPQDAFPAGDLADIPDWTHSVRFDMAADTADPSDWAIVPGDSIVITVALEDGTTLNEAPRMVCCLLPNTGYDPLRVTFPWVEEPPGRIATVLADTVRDAWGQVVTERWAFDLPDTGLLFAGDLLRFFFAADYAIDGIPEGTVMLPADTAGFSAPRASLVHPWIARYSMAALPTQEGVAQEPGLPPPRPPCLLWDDTGDADRLQIWVQTLANLGWLAYEDFDLFRTRAPDEGLNNGLSCRAAFPVLEAGYELLIYASGDRAARTIQPFAAGVYKGDDVQLLEQCLDTLDHDLLLVGDHVVGDLAATPSGLAFLGTYAGVGLGAGGTDVSTVIGGQQRPVVVPVPAAGVFDQSWALNSVGRSFDDVTADGSTPATPVSEYLTAAGFPFVPSVPAAWHYELSFPPNQVMLLPWGLDAVVFTARAALPSRALVLQDALEFLGFATGSGSGIPDLPECTVSCAAGQRATVRVSPGAGGLPLTQAFTDDGYPIDATITLTVRDGAGRPVPWLPAEDLWLVSTAGGFVYCPGGSIADGPTDAAGTTTFSGLLHGGGWTYPPTERLLVMVFGDPVAGQDVDVQVVSADINGDLVVDLADLGIFTNDFFGSFQVRSDLRRDGVLDIWDVLDFKEAMGSECP